MDASALPGVQGDQVEAEAGDAELTAEQLELLSLGFELRVVTSGIPGS
jgi:hypothetical protein